MEAHAWEFETDVLQELAMGWSSCITDCVERRERAEEELETITDQLDPLLHKDQIISQPWRECLKHTTERNHPLFSHRHRSKSSYKVSAINSVT